MTKQQWHLIFSFLVGCYLGFVPLPEWHPVATFLWPVFTVSFICVAVFIVKKIRRKK